MRNRFNTLAVCVVASGWLAGSALAQAPAPPAAGAAPVSNVSPNPTYATIFLEIEVSRPAAEVWKRIGKYCDIGEWFGMQCTMLSGKEGEVGAVRSVGNEIMVGKSEMSYTYTQPLRAGRVYDMYHGTLEARPLTATTSKLFYTLMYDNSMMADDAAREADKQRRITMFNGAMQNMKTLAEGGTIAPRARGAGPGGPGRGAPPAGAPPAGAPGRAN